MTTSGTYAAFLAIGVVLIVADGQLVYRSGVAFLQDLYDSMHAAAAANRLTTALFHLIMLGILALLALAPPAGPGFTSVLAHVGILLLLLAIAHGVVMAVLAALRRRQHEAQLSESLSTPAPPTVDRRHTEAARGVAPDVPTQRPTVAPNLDERR